ncbi:efflux RND transporter periplasmic adaptor subunit [Arcobacter sp. LA11]|uniref:efflux RND transporter periplasmic adaptor subunit n=1 Tax=Arcobacter sp. LA11 TaxID=1898176 RepID=UPI00093502B9|nr:efflux RND transporter periplasmic adaptor subunit [Arcobacter sp. LA11]
MMKFNEAIFTSRKYIAVFCIAILFVSCTKEEKKIEKKEDSLKIVFAVKAKLKDENENRVFNATASSNNQIKLSFKVQGNINYFKYQLGDEVKKGSLIARLDAKPYELRVSQTDYALSEARASLQNAKSNYERTKKLYVNQNASASDIDNAKASYNAASAKVQNIRKELEYAKLQLSYTKLYAPQDGYISVKYVQENENITIGTPIVLISDKVVDEVKVQVPESFINKIKKDENVKVVFDSLDENRAFSAKISEISKFASSNTKTYQVIVKLNDSSKLIRSGMSANVFFKTIEKNVFEKRTLIVPSTSILNDKSGYFVYILDKKDENYIVKKQKVEVGKLIKKGYEVISGLDKNSLVLKAGMSEVYENMKVEIGNLKDLGN